MIRVVIKKFSPVAFAVAILFSNVPVAHAADPLFATRSPSAAANIGTTGTGWSASTVTRALLVDGSETNLTNALPANGASMLLVLTGFSFDIPAGATIAGVAVSVTRRSTSSSGTFVRDAAIELVGGFGTSSSLASEDVWPATIAAAAYGGPAALWGGSLTPDDVNAAKFGLAIAAQNTDPPVAHNGHVDSASVHFDIGVVDATPPVIALTGGDLTLAFGDTFADLGYAANDVVDGTVAVAVGGAVDISTAGEYTLTYDATDAAGNRAIQQTRIVTVFPAAEVVASPTPSGGNGAPVGLYGTINTVVPIGNAEQTAGNVGIGAGGEVLGAEAYRFTDPQISALLVFLRAFGVDPALVDALGNVLCSPQGDALRSISTLSLDTVTDTTATLTATSTTP